MNNEPPNDEEEPDVRFTYANERTFLAWNRTALALIATVSLPPNSCLSSTSTGVGASSDCR
jgi:hypothetical protein